MALRGGIDLGGTKMEAVVVDDASEVLGSARRETPRTGGPDDVVRELVEVLREAATAAGVEPAELAGVGVGSPGEVDRDAGTVARAGNLPGWNDAFPLVTVLGRSSASPSRSATTSAWRSRRSACSARGRRTARSSASGGAPASAARS